MSGSLKFKVTSGGVPVGSYVGEFLGLEEGANEKGQYLKWMWKIVQGPHSGATVGRITSKTPTLRNACGAIITGILGRSVKDGEDVDLEVCLGRKYLLIVKATEGGATRVDTVSLPPT